MLSLAIAYVQYVLMLRVIHGWEGEAYALVK